MKPVVAALRIARWQVANVLRLTGRADEATAGAPDAYVHDDLALLHAQRGDATAARQAAARAKEVRDGGRR